MNLLAILLLSLIPLSASPKKIGILLGSTRQGRTSHKIGAALQAIAITKQGIETHIIDLRDFNLPFIYEETSPAQRTKIADPCIQKWSKTISSFDAFIFVVPTYNAGYPGELKNAIDLLYKEWAGKPVSFVGYSGGNTGGSEAIDGLTAVTKACNMIPVTVSVKIPTAWKAFDAKGELSSTITAEATEMIDNLMTHIKE